ncbi:MAG: RraA family protein [Lentisphaerae bacterium]|nr:MAG: RraA family protein [Lentisphaerota bacterium]
MERIERFKIAGYGGGVSDALVSLGIRGGVLSQRFIPLIPGQVICGRALPVKLHADPGIETEEGRKRMDEYWERHGGHPQKRMMRTVAEKEDGTVLCFDCGGDMQPAHFGEMSSQVAYAHGCRGMIIAGNCRDTRYIRKMKDFPVYSFGRTPNAFGGWYITEVDVPIWLPGHLTHYVCVNPGDFIFGDDDGIQVIPADYVDEVLLRTEIIHEFENREREQLRAGMPVDEVYRQFGVL